MFSIFTLLLIGSTMQTSILTINETKTFPIDGNPILNIKSEGKNISFLNSCTVNQPIYRNHLRLLNQTASREKYGIESVVNFDNRVSIVVKREHKGQALKIIRIDNYSRLEANWEIGDEISITPDSRLNILRDSAQTSLLKEDNFIGVRYFGAYLKIIKHRYDLTIQQIYNITLPIEYSESKMILSGKAILMMNSTRIISEFRFDNGFENIPTSRSEKTLKIAFSDFRYIRGGKYLFIAENNRSITISPTFNPEDLNSKTIQFKGSQNGLRFIDSMLSGFLLKENTINDSGVYFLDEVNLELKRYGDTKYITDHQGWVDLGQVIIKFGNSSSWISKYNPSKVIHSGELASYPLKNVIIANFNYTMKMSTFTLASNQTHQLIQNDLILEGGNLICTIPQIIHAETISLRANLTYPNETKEIVFLYPPFNPPKVKDNGSSQNSKSGLLKSVILMILILLILVIIIGCLIKVSIQDQSEEAEKDSNGNVELEKTPTGSMEILNDTSMISADDTSGL